MSEIQLSLDELSAARCHLENEKSELETESKRAHASLEELEDSTKKVIEELHVPSHMAGRKFHWIAFLVNTIGMNSWEYISYFWIIASVKQAWQFMKFGKKETNKIWKGTNYFGLT